VLAPALAARPGRVDLAVEIGLPDQDARRRLLRLYGRDLDLQLGDEEGVVMRTSGVTAAFIKELMRTAAVVAASRSDGAQGIVVRDRDVAESLEELLTDRSALTRVLLGGAREGVRSPGRTEWLLAEEARCLWF